MRFPEEIVLHQVEKDWLDAFTLTMLKMPKALTLRINSLGDGSVEVFSAKGKDFTPAQLRWVQAVESLLATFPKSPEFWSLSNIDGFHVGKGIPSTFSGTGYSAWGAMSTYSDNYSDFYLVSFPVDYLEFADGERNDYDVVCLRSCNGDLKVWNVTETGRSLS
ncbi:hypothetical protein [Vibrio sp. Hal054]|uniref:hypothetical protein n=1 Tax=Vibrio sp. Hal054 TaxID=3035158 RepID=UPI00301BE5BF